MNLDTDFQYAFTSGVRAYMNDKKDYICRQIGNPDGNDIPNKKYYDPRMPVRAAETSTTDRLQQVSTRRRTPLRSRPPRLILGGWCMRASTVDRDRVALPRPQCFEDLLCVNILGLGEAPEPSNVLGPRRGALPV